jgi:hypothetical protein
MSGSISVLLSAYGPSPYLGDALRSVLSQATPGQPQEIVLLTDRPRPLDRLRGEYSADGLDLRQVLCPEPRKGPFFAAGIRACRGDIISFLNDDDLWLPGRLTSVDLGMSLDPDVGLHRSGVQFLIPPAPHPSGLPRRRHPGTVGTPVRFQRRGGRWSRRLGHYDLGFNDSTLSVRRNILQRADPYLSRIQASEDTFFLFAALALTGQLVYDPAPLVLYRVGSQLPSVLPSDGAAGLIDSLHREFSQRIGTFQTIREMVADLSPDRRELGVLADRGVAFYELLTRLVGETPGRSVTLSMILRLLALWPTYDPALNLGLAGAGALSLVHRSLASRFILRAGLGRPMTLPPDPSPASGGHLPALHR